MTIYDLTGTATDTLGAADTDDLAYTVPHLIGSPRTVTRSLLANRINWDSVVSSVVQGPTFSDVRPQDLTATEGVVAPPAQVTVSQIFSVLAPCRLTGFRVYKAPNATGTAIAVRLWSGITTGTELAATTIPSWVVDGGGWRQVTFSSSVDLVPNVTYVIGVHIPSGIYAYSEWVYNGQDTVVWPILAKSLTDFGTKTNGNAAAYLGTGITFPTHHTAANFYIDPQVEWDDPMPGYSGGTTYYDQWTNPNPHSRFAFPIGVAFADPPFLQGYLDAGVNTLIGGFLSHEDYQVAMNAMGNAMDWWAYIEPLTDELVFVQQENPALAAQVRAYQVDDEPDQSVGSFRSPSTIQGYVNYMRGRDSTKPLYLNFGIPVALNQGFFGAPSGSGQQLQNEYWRQWAATSDIISLDQYNLTDDRDPYDRYGTWVYAAQVGRVLEVCDDAKPVFVWIETTSNTPSQPTPDQVRKTVWATLIAGARMVAFFDHRFASDFVTQDFAAMLHDPPMLAMVTDLCTLLQELGPALLGRELGLVTAWTSTNTTEGPKGGTYGVPIHYTSREDDTYEYVFAQAIRPGATTGTLTIPSWAGETVEVIDESRDETVSVGGVLTDTFAADYQFHLYRRIL